MPKFLALSNTWDTIKEVDLRPLRQQAQDGIRIALVGAPGSGRLTLANQMRRDPSHPDVAVDTPLQILDLDTAEQAASANLVILVLDSRQTDFPRERELAQGWRNSGKRVLVFINQFEEPGESVTIIPWVNWAGKRVVRGSALDTEFLIDEFAPAVVDLVPDKILGLGRYFPLFRVPVARYLINDTCFSNAAYSLSTGMAEIVPILDIPLNVADMLILTKTQAYLVYKIGLALGLSTRWQDYVTEFGGILGGGFLWRQLARSLVGLIPVWGIIPKVSVAYAGTYVVGNVILRWYLTGRHIDRKQMRDLYVQAFARGKNLARNLVSRIPRPQLPRPRLPRARLPRPRLPRRKSRGLPSPATTQECLNCGQHSAIDASYCQYCGKSFQEIPLSEASSTRHQPQSDPQRHTDQRANQEPKNSKS